MKKWEIMNIKFNVIIIIMNFILFFKPYSAGQKNCDIKFSLLWHFFHNLNIFIINWALFGGYMNVCGENPFLFFLHR